MNSGKSVFVDNIPPNVNKIELETIFGRLGSVHDVCIHKKSRCSSAAFLRYDSHEEAAEAVLQFNGLLVDDVKLHVSIAKPCLRLLTNNGSSNKNTQRNNNQDQEDYEEDKEQPRINMEKEEALRTVQAFKSEKVIQQGRRSLAILSLCQLSTTDISMLLGEWGFNSQDIIDYGGFKFMASYESVECKEWVLKELKRGMQSKCITVREWTEDESCERRALWVEIFGIPSFSRCRETYERAVKRIGELKEVKEDLSPLSSVKALIYSSIMAYIEDRFILEVCKFRSEIFVRELHNDVRIAPNYFCVPNAAQKHAYFRL